MRASTAGIALLTTVWAGFQWHDPSPPPVMDQILTASYGIWFANMMIDKKRPQSDVSPTRIQAGKPKVDWTKHAEKLLEAAEPAPSYYCQMGDHLVDHLVWLEQITCGCKPCMVKLRATYAESGHTLRLWKVEENGITRVPVEEKKKNDPITKDVHKPTEALRQKPAAPPRSPKTWIREHQDWTCRVCESSYDRADGGEYNTVLGFICESCLPARELGQPWKANAAEQYRRVLGVSQIPGPAVKKEGRWVERTSVDAGETVRVSGGSCSIRIRGDVGKGALLSASGGGGFIEVFGDVEAGATIKNSGGGGEIHIHGYIHEGCVIHASGGNMRIFHHGADATASILTTGGNGVVQDRSGKKSYPFPRRLPTTTTPWTPTSDPSPTVDGPTLARAKRSKTSSSETSGATISSLQDEIRSALSDTAPSSKGKSTRSKPSSPGSSGTNATDSGWAVRSRADLPPFPKQRQTHYVEDTDETVTRIGDSWIRVAIPKYTPKSETVRPTSVDPLMQALNAIQFAQKIADKGEKRCVHHASVYGSKFCFFCGEMS